MHRLVRILALAVTSLAVGWWLFADTLARRTAVPGREGPLRFSYWGGYDDHVLWNRIIDGFRSHNGDVDIRPEWLPLSGYGTKLDQQFVAGSAPDVILFQDEPFPRYAAEQFLPLDELLRGDAESRRRLADCWPTAAESFRCAGALRGVPIMGGNVLIYCNLDAFDRAAKHHGRPVTPPSDDWTLDEFVAVCRDLTFDADGDGRADQFAFLQPHWVYYMPFVWAHGATFTDESRTRWTLLGPAAERAFALYADLRHRYGVSPEPMEYAGQNSDTAFLAGRVAMCVNGPWFTAFLRETAMRDRYRVVSIPRGPGGNATRITWDALCINAQSSPDRQAKAWRFVRYVLSTEAQNVFAEHQRAVPVRRASAESYVRFGGGPGGAAARFIAEMANARVQPITRDWMPMGRAISWHLTSVILDGPARKSPAEAVAALAADPAIRAAFRVESPPAD